MHATVEAPPVGSEVPASLKEAVWQSIHEFCVAALVVEPGVQPMGGPEAPFDGVIGAISFVGDLGWSVSLGFPRDTAVALSAKFAGFEIEFDSDDMGDVVGEIVNGVAGYIVAQLDERGIQAQMSIPTVTRGHELQVIPVNRQKCCGRHFITPDGPFWAHVTVFAAFGERGSARSL